MPACLGNLDGKVRDDFINVFKAVLIFHKIHNLFLYLDVSGMCQRRALVIHKKSNGLGRRKGVVLILPKRVVKSFRNCGA